MNARLGLAFSVCLLAPLACVGGPLPMGDTEGGETGGDTDGGGEDGGDTGEPPAGCIEGDALGRALAIVDSAAQHITVLWPGSEAIELPASLPAGVDAPATVLASQAGDYLAVTSAYSVYDPVVVDEGAVLRLYEVHTGALAWERAFADYRLGSTYVDEQGRVSASVGWSSEAGPAGVFVIDGQLTELSEFQPAGPIGSSGWLPGWIVDPLSKETLGSGLYNAFDHQLIPVTSGTTPPGWRAGDESIEHIDNDAPVPRLVHTRPEGHSTIELAPFAGIDGLVFMMSHAGDYRLVATFEDGSDQPPTLARVHVPSGEVMAIELEPPPGLSAFDCYSQNSAIDLDGRVLVELRDEGAAQIHAWDPEEGTWTALGLPVTAVDDLAAPSRFGRVHEIHASGANTTYCLPSEWSAPPASALPGTSIQLARLDPPLNVVVDAEGWGAVTVDPQERCASWAVEGGRRIVDLDDGDELELPRSGQVIWLE